MLCCRLFACTAQHEIFKSHVYGRHRYTPRYLLRHRCKQICSKSIQMENKDSTECCCLRHVALGHNGVPGRSIMLDWLSVYIKHVSGFYSPIWYHHRRCHWGWTYTSWRPHSATGASRRRKMSAFESMVVWLAGTSCIVTLDDAIPVTRQPLVKWRLPSYRYRCHPGFNGTCENGCGPKGSLPGSLGSR